MKKAVKPRSAQETLTDLGENELVRLLTSSWKIDGGKVLVGTGDDCAVLRGEGKNHFLIFKTDVVVEGAHFTTKTEPRLIGRKALARALSDLAAMGARPLAGVITLGLPPTESVSRLRAIYWGLEQAAQQYGVNLVGGETTQAGQLFLNVALLGECRGYRPILRSGAKPGDSLFVTGRLGGTQKTHHLRFEPRLAEGEWLARGEWASSLMDLSDGLGADLPRLAAASQVSISIDETAVPRTRGASLQGAWNDGEDYELLFTVSRNRAAALKKKWPFATPLHCMGSVGLAGEAATPLPFSSHGFDHFKQRAGNAGARRKLGG